MRKSRFTESQILKILKEVEGGRKVADASRVPRSPFTPGNLYFWLALTWGGLQFTLPDGF